MRRVSTYTLLVEIISYQSNESVGKHIPLKDIPLEIGGALKDKDKFGNGKRKLVRT